MSIADFIYSQSDQNSIPGTIPHRKQRKKGQRIKLKLDKSRPRNDAVRTLAVCPICKGHFKSEAGVKNHCRLVHKQVIEKKQDKGTKRRKLNGGKSSKPYVYTYAQQQSQMASNSHVQRRKKNPPRKARRGQKRYVDCPIVAI